MIKINKIIFLISVLIFTLTNKTFAENASDCSVSQTSESIVNYIKDDRKIVSNILSNLEWWNDTSTIKWKWSDAYDKIRSKMIRLSNSLFSWNWYESYFKFYVLVPIDQELPYEIIRDHKILQNEGKMLEKILEKLMKNNNDWSNISKEKLCEWINEKEDCELKIWKLSNAGNVINELIKNNTNITDLFRSSVIWYTRNNPSTFLIDSDDLKSKYSNTRLSEYSKNCWVWKKFGDKMDEITNWQKVTKDWKIAWEDALLRLRCSWVSAAWVCSSRDSAKYKELEKKLLKNELSRQWLSSNMTKKMLQNLNDFNNKCKWNDLLANIICWAKQSVKNSAKAIYNWESQKWEDWWFIQNFLSTLEWITSNWFWKKENVSINALSETNAKTKKDDEIKAIINKLYNNWEVTLWQKADTEDKLQSRIIDIHISLIKAIEELDDTYKNSEKVCEQQWAWLWSCKTNW